MTSVYSVREFVGMAAEYEPSASLIWDWLNRIEYFGRCPCIVDPSGTRKIENGVVDYWKGA